MLWKYGGVGRCSLCEVKRESGTYGTEGADSGDEVLVTVLHVT